MDGKTRLFILVAFLLAECALGKSFDLVYRSPENAREQDVKELLQASGRIRDVTRALNKVVSLPRRVTVQLGGGLIPLYDPETRTIAIPYAFVGMLFDSLAEELESERVGAVAEVIEFVLYHEVGHALIDLLRLPPRGPLEESADELAALLSIEIVGGNGEIALSAARLLSLQPKPDLETSGVSYSVSSRRFEQLVCWVVGSDPGRLMWIAEETGMDSFRADSCPREYEEMRDYWFLLLRPHLRR